MYLDRDSFLHRLDPRTKMLVVCFFMATALMFYNVFIQIGLLTLALIYASLGKCSKNILKLKFVYLSIFTVSFIMWTISIRTGQPVLWFITIDGLNKGASAGLALIVIVISSLAFISTTKIEEMSAALIKLGLSYRGAFAMSTAIRMVPLIVNTGFTILQAQKSRGLDVDSGSILTRLKKYLPLMVPAIVSVIRGTNVFSMALESKGFGYSDKRTQYMQIKFSASDYVFCLCVLLLFAAAIYYRFTFYTSVFILIS